MRPRALRPRACAGSLVKRRRRFARRALLFGSLLENASATERIRIRMRDRFAPENNANQSANSSFAAKCAQWPLPFARMFLAMPRGSGMVRTNASVPRDVALDRTA